jgi:DNA-binding PadR family transcriptional regulator
MAERERRPVAEAAAEATRAAGAGKRRRERGAARGSELLGAELRRGEILPLLVLHLVEAEPAYGNRLIEEIGAISEGAITVNPNTIYPLLRQLESEGRIEGRWEHPDRRTRRFYAITAAGRAELERLRAELEPVLGRMSRTIDLIKREIYG